MQNWRSKFFLFFLFLIIPLVNAEEYTFERAEELKPLIEWRDYGDAAFEEARLEKKPIFLLLTAPSWCYWCQVYESEDYLFNSEVVAYLNSNFIPVYVDADKRQDLTRQYLEGGWPSTTIFSPSKKRLLGWSGPRPVEWMLSNLANSVAEVERGVFAAKVSYEYTKGVVSLPTTQDLLNLIGGYSRYTLQAYDSEHGGFGSGQKFPQGRALDHALELYENSGDSRWLDLVENTLANQYTSVEDMSTNYNLFDPLDGGFHRYGTARDWSPPHYEKMLYDNARLLKAYYHLMKVKPSVMNQEVVEKTLAFISSEWYDPNGGFYGNSDVHGEEEYYGKNPRPTEKPRVEKTKYSDWNAEAILTYLYLWEEGADTEHRDMAKDSLDFFAKEMVSKEGMYHYMDVEGDKGVRGNLFDNAYMLLAFVEGYEVLGDSKYLDAALQIASFSIDNLFDWHAGGFFERNSPDKSLYALGDHILLAKPGTENGVMAYAMLKLYAQTEDKLYLHAGLSTLGNMKSEVGGLDRGYYFLKAAEFTIANDLLASYEVISVPSKFWLDELLDEKSFSVTTEGLEPIKGSFLLFVLVALLAGFLSFASPCTLPILPAFVAYTFKSSKHNIKGMTLCFFLGLSLVFSLLGMSASAVGGFLKSNLVFFSQIAGITLMFFGVFTLLGAQNAKAFWHAKIGLPNFVHKGFSGLKMGRQRPTSFLGSFIFGAALGISWTPCVGPLLVAILVVASTTTVWAGGFILFCYALGLGLPLLLLSYYLGRVDKKGRLWQILQGRELSIGRLKIHSNTLISGLLFLILGYLIWSGGLTSLNRILAGTGVQQSLFAIEEAILGLLR